jgi:hypothetical protein
MRLRLQVDFDLEAKCLFDVLSLALILSLQPSETFKGKKNQNRAVEFGLCSCVNGIGDKIYRSEDTVGRK